jgi:hypothetical protein
MKDSNAGRIAESSVGSYDQDQLLTATYWQNKFVNDTAQITQPLAAELFCDSTVSNASHRRAYRRKQMAKPIRLSANITMAAPEPPNPKVR